MQLTYNLLLRVGPDGDDLAHLGVRDSDGLWWWNGQQWSDVVIYAK